VTSSAILRRIELLEREVATPRKPKLLLCWTKKLVDKIQQALGPSYILVTVTCKDEDAFEAMIRESPVESERLDKLLAGIPPD
jgi:hypothetical protein